MFGNLFEFFWGLMIIFFWVTAFVIWFNCFLDLFRRDDLSGVMKAVWVVALIFIPWVGAIVYLVTARGSPRPTSRRSSAPRRPRRPPRKVSTADELAKLAQLKDVERHQRAAVRAAQGQAAGLRLAAFARHAHDGRSPTRAGRFDSGRAALRPGSRPSAAATSWARCDASCRAKYAACDSTVTRPHSGCWPARPQRRVVERRRAASTVARRSASTRPAIADAGSPVAADPLVRGGGVRPDRRGREVGLVLVEQPADPGREQLLR